MTQAGDLQAFEAQRPRLKRLAYRMLGSVAEAEDAVQDAWLRWTRAGEGPSDPVADPAAWLVRATSRLCIDRLRAAKVRREAYRGPWLPEPLVEEMSVDPVERAEDVSVAFLLALERLSPLERAVFLLHDVFEAGYAEVALTLGRREAAVRQLAARARTHVQDARPRFTVSQDEAARLTNAFAMAAAQGDMATLSALLAKDAVMITDGGGKRKAAMRKLVGPQDIISLLEGLAWRAGGWLQGEVRAVRINGYPGFVVDAADGPTTIAFQPGDHGQIEAIYVMRNPDKLGHLTR
jgi:RNA polymerase sigma-70 factor (ECF subfamily)